MGLFSSKKKTYVSSVTYNLAGDEEERLNIPQYLVMQSTMQGRSLAENLTDTILWGQSYNYNAAYRYARDHYYQGVPVSNMSSNGSVDQAVIENILDDLVPTGYSVEVLTTLVDTAQYHFWAEEYLTERYGYDRSSGVFDTPPPGVAYTATISYDISTPNKVYINYINPDSSVVNESIFIDNYIAGRNYVHAAFKGKRTSIDQDNIVTRPYALGDVDSTTTTTGTTIAGDEKQTTTTVVIVDTDGVNTSTHTKVTIELITRSQYFMYMIGAGTYPELDALGTDELFMSPFLPAVPLRRNNKDILAPQYQNSPLYKTSKKFLEKVNINIEDLRESINDNPQLKDIDYAYVTFGVSIRSQTQAGMAYLFAFFEDLLSVQVVNKAGFQDWKSSSDRDYRAPNTNQLYLYNSAARADNYDIKIQWQYIDKTVHVGQVFPGAKKGDHTSTMGPKNQYSIIQIPGPFNFVDTIVDASVLTLRKQIAPNAYEQLQISGLVFNNYVYKGKSVDIVAKDAFDNEDEEGFLVPLNMDIVKQLQGIRRVELCYESAYMVFNCYKVVKKKWYQRGAFKVLLVVVAIAITVVSWGTAGPAAGSLASAAWGGLVGIGVSALVASIIVATASVLASLIVANLATDVGTKLFGETWGRVFGALVAIATAQFASAGSFSNMATNFSKLTVTNLLNATNSLANVYNSYIQGQMIELAEEASETAKMFEEKFEEVEKLLKELLGGPDLLDIKAMNDAAWAKFESPDEFLTRTLLTGSDIVGITHGMISNFTDATLDVNPYSA